MLFAGYKITLHPAKTFKKCELSDGLLNKESNRRAKNVQIHLLLYPALAVTEGEQPTIYLLSTFPIVSAASFWAEVVTWA